MAVKSQNGEIKSRAQVYQGGKAQAEEAKGVAEADVQQ
jgi:hypothetical protein